METKMMTYQLTDEELQQVPGCTPLKIFIVLNNSPNGMTAAELAGRLHIPERTVFHNLAKMSEVAHKYCQKWHTLQDVALSARSCTDLLQDVAVSATFDKEKEKNQKKEESLTTTSTTTRMREDLDEKEILFSWLTEREDYLHELAKRNGLLKEGGGETHTQTELIEVFRPYIEEFAERLRLEDVDIWLKGRHDTLKHFYSWLPKYMRAKEAEDNNPLLRPKGHLPCLRGGVASTLTKEQQDEQLLQKRRRMEKAAELERHLDEQNRAAENSTQSEGYLNIMARFGHNKPKNNNDKERRKCKKEN